MKQTTIEYNKALIRVEVNLNRSKSAERKPFIWHNTKWEDVWYASFNSPIVIVKGRLITLLMIIKLKGWARHHHPYFLPVIPATTCKDARRFRIEGTRKC
jgi:hypothetical protein